LRWKDSLLTFPSICRTSKTDSICNRGSCFRVTYSCSPNQTHERHLISAIPINSDRIFRWDQLHWKFYHLSFPSICRTFKTEFICNRGTHFRVMYSYSPNRTHERHLVSTIPVNSERIFRWDQLHWKAYHLTFPSIRRTSKTEFICYRGACFRVTYSCCPNRTREFNLNSSCIRYRFKAVMTDEKKRAETLLAFILGNDRDYTTNNILVK